MRVFQIDSGNTFVGPFRRNDSEKGIPMAEKVRRLQERGIMLRVSDTFKADLMKAVKKSNLANLSEFVRMALIEKAERLGVKVRR